MLRLGFRANMRPGRYERRVFARTTNFEGKADFSYRGIVSSETLATRLCHTIGKNKHFPLLPSLYSLNFMFLV